MAVSSSGARRALAPWSERSPARPPGAHQRLTHGFVGTAVTIADPGGAHLALFTPRADNR